MLPGKPGAREFFSGILGELPDATLAVPTQVFVGDVLYIEWTAESPLARVTDGVDTLVFTDDGIRAQTVHCTVQRTAAG